jgi:hypothetical protein
VKGIVKIATVGILVFASMTAFAQGPRRDGQWEIKTEMSMPGMPMSMPPTTMMRCVTKEQAQDPLKSLPQGGPGQDKCTMSDYKSEGSKATWKMTCQGDNAMSGTGEIVYKENTFESVMNMEGQGHKMMMKSTGKRLGDCVK